MAEILHYILAIIEAAFAAMSGVLMFIAPIFTFMAVCDLGFKGKRVYPLVVHFAGFFGIFSFIHMLFSIIDGPKLPQWFEWLSILGLVLLWISIIYVGIMEKFRR